MEVLLPFVVDGGPTVLVDRGYVRPLPGSRVPPIAQPPRGTVTVTARLRDSEGPVLDKESFVSDGVRQVYSINTSQIATLTGVPLAGSYLQLVDDQPGGLGVIGLPHLDAGPFLSYGIQWITFGVVAPILLGYFVYAEVRARRAEKAQASPAKTDGKPRDRRGQAHRPLRTAALSPTNTSAAAACTARESRTARRKSVTVGGGPAPRAGRICIS